jgi:hypothetical protein
MFLRQCGILVAFALMSSNEQAVSNYDSKSGDRTVR